MGTLTRHGDDPVLRDHQDGPANSLAGLDREELKIFRQSLPSEAITRDFLQELLEEHRGNTPHGGGSHPAK
ncbi:hypothetical protein [Ramlibacter sp. PS4R-6]|uniref:hypothetical protein n=1 Tax=Ramlibacter sp. PS4R-6 TaxID=3133438 RepID=UPI0030ADB02F